METITDADLVLRARDGDERAKEALFRRHAKMVNGLCIQLFRGRDPEHDELVQDVFVDALRGLDGLSDPSAFAGWLRSIMVHKVRRRIRRRRIAAALGLRSFAVLDAEVVASAAPSPER